MKKIICLLLTQLLLLASLFADLPIEGCGWKWNSGCTLNGKKFYSVAESYNEQDAYVYIEGIGTNRYYLYDTYTYHNGDGTDIIEKYLPYWVEKIGYSIEKNNVRKVRDNKSLAESVKKIMKEKKSDMSVCLFVHGNTTSLIINKYDREDGIYSTFVYPLTAATKNKSVPDEDLSGYYHFKQTDTMRKDRFEFTYDSYTSKSYCKKMNLSPEALEEKKQEMFDGAYDIFSDNPLQNGIAKITDIIQESGMNYLICFVWDRNTSEGVIGIFKKSSNQYSKETIYDETVYNYNEGFMQYNALVEKYLGR